MWGGCVQAYKDFSDKWAYLLDQDMTDAEIASLGRKFFLLIYSSSFLVSSITLFFTASLFSDFSSLSLSVCIKSIEFSIESLLSNKIISILQLPGFEKWKWGNTAARRTMVETSVIGEYFHIYRSFWRSHMCAVDGKPHYLVCPESCDETVPFESCSCKVDALINGKYGFYWFICTSVRFRLSISACVVFSFSHYSVNIFNFNSIQFCPFLHQYNSLHNINQ